MFKTIVVGTDGSPDAEKALRVAAKIAADNEAKLHVVTGRRPMTPGQLRELQAALPEEFWPLLHADYFADECLASATAIAKAVGVDAIGHTVAVAADEAIVETAEAVNADLIVVGSRGEGLTGRMVHGSVSTRVMHHSPCSILVVKHES